jgi:hypothetical protein
MNRIVGPEVFARAAPLRGPRLASCWQPLTAPLLLALVVVCLEAAPLAAALSF